MRTRTISQPSAILLAKANNKQNSTETYTRPPANHTRHFDSAAIHLQVIHPAFSTVLMSTSHTVQCRLGRWRCIWETAVFFALFFMFNTTELAMTERRLKTHTCPVCHSG